MSAQNPVPANPTRVDPPLPRGSWDTHFHIYPPGHPLSATPIFVPPRFPNTKVEAYHAALGITHTVLAHSFAFGTDTASLDEYLSHSTDSHLRRGISILKPDTTSEEITHMNTRGVRGVRAVLGDGDVVQRTQVLKALCDRLDAAGVLWSVCIQDFDPRLYAEIAQHIDTFPVTQTLMLDHLAYLPGAWSRPHAQLGPLSDDLAPILGLLRRDNVCMKLSAPYRVTDEVETLEPLIKAVVAAAPDRVVWGSDWPHAPLHAEMDAMRAQGRQDEVIQFRLEDTPKWLGLLRQWLGEETFHKMMVTNPDRLYK